jgi:thiol-disulfide isomerase/thioredoxin
MRRLISAVLYTALVFGANAAVADVTAASAMREGDMKKLNFHSEAKAASLVEFADPTGKTYSLADWNGKYVVLNFWATWCGPCRKEMPHMDALKQEMQSDTFDVVTIATGRNEMPAITRFFSDAEIESLPILLDPKSKLAREMGVLGLPVTVILNPEGQEIARMQGEADWSSDNAKAILNAVMSGS